MLTYRVAGIALTVEDPLPELREAAGEVDRPWTVASAPDLGLDGPFETLADVLNAEGEVFCRQAAGPGGTYLLALPGPPRLRHRPGDPVGARRRRRPGRDHAAAPDHRPAGPPPRRPRRRAGPALERGRPPWPRPRLPRRHRGGQVEPGGRPRRAGHAAAGRRLPPARPCGRPVPRHPGLPGPAPVGRLRPALRRRRRRPRPGRPLHGQAAAPRGPGAPADPAPRGHRRAGPAARRPTSRRAASAGSSGRDAYIVVYQQVFRMERAGRAVPAGGDGPHRHAGRVACRCC